MTAAEAARTDALRLVVIAGPNGSGKSRLTRDGTVFPISLPLPKNYINADDIARSLKTRDDWASASDAERAMEAFVTARHLRASYRQQRLSVAFETVFSHPSTLLDMQEYRRAGYHVTLIYLATEDVDLNLKRVAIRVKQGGHDVPPEKVEKRYLRSLGLLPRAVEEADEAFVFDGTFKARLCVQKTSTGRLRIKPALPEYMKQCLVEPFRLRENERSQLNDFAGAAGLVNPPNEKDGTYVGVFHKVLTHYGLQETGAGFFCPHDLSSVETEQTLPQPGEMRTIRYKDGQSTVHLPTTDHESDHQQII